MAKKEIPWKVIECMGEIQKNKSTKLSVHSAEYDGSPYAYVQESRMNADGDYKTTKGLSIKMELLPELILLLEKLGQMLNAEIFKKEATKEMLEKLDNEFIIRISVEDFMGFCKTIITDIRKCDYCNERYRCYTNA